MKFGFVDNGCPPAPFPPLWGRSWGQDNYGLWAVINIEGREQKMRWIRPGVFMMGSPRDEIDRFHDEYHHKVCLSEGFWLADTTCTQELWNVVVGDRSGKDGNVQLPVNNVSWDDCQVFIEIINDMDGRFSLALPTEPQWEYACRAGTQTSFYFGDDITPTNVNFNGDGVVPVKKLPCNAWGLYQMHGNVWEWCADWYEDYQKKMLIESELNVAVKGRVLRGGSWNLSRIYARSANRSAFQPSSRDERFGFRFCII